MGLDISCGGHESSWGSMKVHQKLLQTDLPLQGNPKSIPMEGLEILGPLFLRPSLSVLEGKWGGAGNNIYVEYVPKGAGKS